MYTTKNGIQLKTGFYWVVYPPPLEFRNDKQNLITMVFVDMDKEIATEIGQRPTTIADLLYRELQGKLAIAEHINIPEQVLNIDMSK